MGRLRIEVNSPEWMQGSSDAYDASSESPLGADSLPEWQNGVVYRTEIDRFNRSIAGFKMESERLFEVLELPRGTHQAGGIGPGKVKVKS